MKVDKGEVIDGDGLMWDDDRDVIAHCLWRGSALSAISGLKEKRSSNGLSIEIRIMQSERECSNKNQSFCSISSLGFLGNSYSQIRGPALSSTSPTSTSSTGTSRMRLINPVLDPTNI